MTSAPAKLTEADLLAMLARRHSEAAGNGPAWAFLTHVRDAAGFDAKRTIDAVAMSLWPSRGLLLHGFEVKCSRSDWQRELKDPSKAEQFCALVDRFWLVVADAKIVHDGELPPAWGLLAARGDKLVQIKAATPLRQEAGKRGATPLPDRFGRSFVAALLRAAGATRDRTPDEVAELVLQARAAGRQEAERNARIDALNLARLREIMRDFEKASGLRLETAGSLGYDARRLGETVRRVLDDERVLESVDRRLGSLRDHAQGTLDALERLEAARARREASA